MAQKLLYPVINGKKQCGECGEILTINNFTITRKNSKDYYQSKCKKCINKYGAEYRKRVGQKEKIKQYQQDYMNNKENRDKKNSYIRQWRKKDDIKLRKNKERRIWTAK